MHVHVTTEVGLRVPAGLEGCDGSKLDKFGVNVAKKGLKLLLQITFVELREEVKATRRVIKVVGECELRIVPAFEKR